MTGKASPRAGEARDATTSHYVFEAPIRSWHWLTMGCMLILMVTGYFTGQPLPSVSSEAIYLFYMSDIRLMHFVATMVFTVILLVCIYWAFVGNRYSRELFIVPVWRRSWWQGVYSVVRWYLFLEKEPGDDIDHNPIAQAAMCDYLLLSIFMVLTGFALYSEHNQYAVFTPFRYVTKFFHWTDGNPLDIHGWHRLGMWFIVVFIVGHIYIAIREDIVSDGAVVSTIINDSRSHKFPKGQHDKEALWADLTSSWWA